MKSAWQIVVVLAVLMGIVGGATYLTQFTNRTPPKRVTDDPGGKKPGDVVVGDPLVFPNKKSVWKLDTDESEMDDRFRNIKQVEPLSQHHYDFLFFNPHP